LPAKFVFHAVGPVYRDGRRGEPDLLASCYRECLAMAEERGVVTISFPAISTGVYGYPLPDATAIAIREVKAHLGRLTASVREVTFVLFGRSAWKAYASVLNE
jgi:O-acetyl-ADP-ribose deacetylase (regulator of RNase III)